MKRLIALILWASLAFAQGTILPHAAQMEPAQGSSTPADFVWMPGGSSGVLVTPTSQTATTFGTFTGYTWNLNFHSPLQHTRGYPGSVIRPVPFLVGGVRYDGAGFNQIEFDLSAALIINSSPLYEDVRLSFPAGVKSMTVSSQITYAATAGSSDTSFDVLSLQTGGAYAVAQYNITTGNVNSLRVETQGGNRGRNITIPDKLNAYVTDLRIKAADNYGIVALINPLTFPPTLIGTSGRADTFGADLASLQIQSYLLLSTSGGGKLRYGGVGFMPTTLPFPTIPGLSIAAPTAVSVTQTNSGQTVLLYTAITQQVKIERSSDAGANWTTLSATYDPVGTNTQRYQDTTVSDSTTYLYRVSAVAGNQSSAPSSTASVTINNAAFITAKTAVFSSAGGGWMGTATNPNGLAASSTATVSFWVKFTTGTSRQRIYWSGPSSGASNRFAISRETTNKFRFQGANSSGTALFDGTTDTTYANGGDWINVYFCVDTNSLANTKVYVNGAVVSVTWTTTPGSGGTIDLQGGRYSIGAKQTDGGEGLNGPLVEMWVAGSYLDSPTSFFRADPYATGTAGHPLTLGANGIVGGVTPGYYFSTNGSGNSWAVDSSGHSPNNDMTVTGTLTTTTPP